MRNSIIAFAMLSILAAVVFVSGCVQQPTGTTTTTVQTSTSSTAAPTTITTSALSSSASVAIQNFAFSPQTVHIAVGGTVTWTNQDSAAHTIVSDTGSDIGSPSLATGQQYSHTFAAAGPYAYHCGIHPSMTGTVIVGSGE